MSGFSLLSVAASLLPLVGASGADQEKGQFVTQVVQERIDPSARMLNIALAEMICGGRGNVCGEPEPVGPAKSEDPNAAYVVIYFPLPNGSCSRYDDNKKNCIKWKENNCVNGLSLRCWQCMLT